MRPSSDPLISPTVSISTLGCKLNQYESESIRVQFREAGYRDVDDPAVADVCVVNTCSVTSTAERKARSLLRGMHRRNPGGRLLAVGCMAERAPQVLADIEGVDAVLGNREKERILDFVRDEKGGEPLIRVGEVKHAGVFGDVASVGSIAGRTRAYLKVQDGCSQKCTYCIIPSLRGVGRSLEICKAVVAAEQLAEQGFAEIVLTGVALGTYGFDLDDRDALSKLLSELSRRIGGTRIRLGSVEPWAVTERLLQVIAESDTICPHLHLPLQSADDSVLRRMNRRYSVTDIQRIFERALALRDDWGVGSDMIVGFPGEDRESFERTRSFIARSPLAYLHVFPYSARPDTPATRLPKGVSEFEKKQRAHVLRDLDAKLRRSFRERHVGTTQQVLLESRRVGTRLAGHTKNYLDVYVNAHESLAGTVRDVHITEVHTDGVVGELTDRE